MRPPIRDERSYTDLLQSVQPVLDDTARGALRRRAARATPTEPADSAGAPADSIVSVLSTFEALSVTLLTEAVKGAPGSRSEPFVSVLSASATTAFLRLEALRLLGGAPLTHSFWIPDTALDRGAGLFDTLAAQAEITISAYLVGVTSATVQRQGRVARTFAEALGPEASLRSLARLASSTLRGTNDVDLPNDRAFEAFPHRSAKAALIASRRLGFGFGRESDRTGRLYDYPGDPRQVGSGAAVFSPRPT